MKTPVSRKSLCLAWLIASAMMALPASGGQDPTRPINPHKEGGATSGGQNGGAKACAIYHGDAGTALDRCARMLSPAEKRCLKSLKASDLVYPCFP